jgi:PKD domain
MSTTFHVRRAGCVLALGFAFVALFAPEVANAVVPPNDNLANATVVSSLPFAESVDFVDATTEPGEPGFCNFSSKTVWYSVTASQSGLMRFSNAGSGVSEAMLRVYRQNGVGFEGLSFLACAGLFWDGTQSLTVNVEAGVTYLVQAGNLFSFSGSLRTSIEAVDPPPNDDFANAKSIGSLPTTSSVDTTAATLEANEPQLCTPPASQRTAWYSFTPSTSGSVTATIPTSQLPAAVGAYVGPALGSLELKGCQYGSPLTIHIDAGVTYYFQVGSFGTAGAPMQFRLAVAPSPVALFYFGPPDPSTYELVNFFDQSHDPGGAQIVSRTWNFGDGSPPSPSSSCCVSHRYAADGDYTTKLTITTADGREASASQPMVVRTHDVAIVRFQIPQKGTVGQTRPISVAIANTRYPESVQVQLYKSVTGSFDRFTLVGTLTQSVPVKSANRSTPFDFSYTFTAEDAAVGKVTFKAVATLVGPRDAAQADNEVISLPIRVD